MSKKIIENISQALRLSGMGIFIFDAFDRVYKPTALSGSLKHLGEFNFALSTNFHQYFLGNQEDSLATFEILEQKQREIGEALKEKEGLKRQLERDPFSYHPLFPEVKYPQYEKFRIEELKAMGEELEGIELEMKELKVQLIIPIPGKEGIIGYLFFGDKKSLDPYFPDDLEFLKTITLAISSALQNAKHHDELQKEIGTDEKPRNCKLFRDRSKSFSGEAVENRTAGVLQRYAEERKRKTNETDGLFQRSQIKASYYHLSGREVSDIRDVCFRGSA